MLHLCGTAGIRLTNVSLCFPAQEAVMLGSAMAKSKWCPTFVIAICMLLSIPKYRVTLEDVAAFMSSNMEAGSRFSKQRVSLVFA